ncbi:MAG: CTP synthase [Clostridium sp.]|nr:CTP synthase [Clostridium sp.]
MEYLQMVLSICGAVSIVGGAGAVIIKVIKPAFRLTKRVEKLEEHSDKDYKRLVALEEMQKQQSKSLAALLNHQITGNGIESMKKIRDELLESIIDN